MPYISESAHHDLLLNNVRMQNALSEIRDAAVQCRSGMQDHLLDDAQRHIRDVLDKVVREATGALPPDPAAAAQRARDAEASLRAAGGAGGAGGAPDLPSPSRSAGADI